MYYIARPLGLLCLSIFFPYTIITVGIVQLGHMSGHMLGHRSGHMSGHGFSHGHVFVLCEVQVTHSLVIMRRGEHSSSQCPGGDETAEKCHTVGSRPSEHMRDS